MGLKHFTFLVFIAVFICVSSFTSKTFVKDENEVFFKTDTLATQHTVNISEGIIAKGMPARNGAIIKKDIENLADYILKETRIE